MRGEKKRTILRSELRTIAKKKKKKKEGRIGEGKIGGTAFREMREALY